MPPASPEKRKARLLLGIDPGTSATGYGLVSLDGNRIRHLDHGAWRPPAKLGISGRLAFLVERLGAYIDASRPDSIAIEQAFLGKNIQSTLRLGEARGALMVACETRGIPPVEYATATVKKAVTGNGRAAKGQVQFMVAKLLGMGTPPEPEDAADALAVALTLALNDRFNARAAGSPARRS